MIKIIVVNDVTVLAFPEGTDEGVIHSELLRLKVLYDMCHVCVREVKMFSIPMPSLDIGEVYAMRKKMAFDWQYGMYMRDDKKGNFVFKDARNQDCFRVKPEKWAFKRMT